MKNGRINPPQISLFAAVIMIVVIVIISRSFKGISGGG
jgi:hypothetical protein